MPPPAETEKPRQNCRAMSERKITSTRRLIQKSGVPIFVLRNPTSYGVTKAVNTSALRDAMSQ